MPAFSLTTPKKAVVSDSPPVTPSDVKALTDVRSENQQAAPLRRGNRAKLPSSKARPQPSPVSQTKPPTPRVKTKPPSRYNNPPAPSPPESDSDEISVAPRAKAPVTPPKAKIPRSKGKGKAHSRHDKPPGPSRSISDGEEISVASIAKAPQPARPKRKAAATAPPLVFDSSTPSEVPPTPPPSKLKRKAARPPSPEPTPSTIETAPSASSASKVDATAILEVLGKVVDSEVSYWKHYMSAIEKNTTSYAAITMEAPPDNNIGNTTASADAEQEKEDKEVKAKITKQKQKQKQEALIHILESLPLRYKALCSAYACKSSPDMEFEDPMLSDDLQNLLNISQNENGEDELEGWYDSRLFEHRYNQKFRDDVLAQDKEVRELEEYRMKSLEALLNTVEDLKCCAEDGLLAKDGDDDGLKSLIGAMDEMGLSAGDPTPSPGPGMKTLPGRVRMSGVNSEDEWFPE